MTPDQKELLDKLVEALLKTPRGVIFLAKLMRKVT